MTNKVKIPPCQNGSPISPFGKGSKSTVSVVLKKTSQTAENCIEGLKFVESTQKIDTLKKHTLNLETLRTKKKNRIE